MTARLFCKTGKTRGLELELEPQGEAFIGRDPASDLVIEQPLMSSRHARIFFDDDAGRFMVEDLSSLNGTALDGDRVASVEPLSHLNVITFAGTYDFFFFDAERLAQRHPESAPAQPSSAEAAQPAVEGGESPDDETTDEVTSIERNPIAMPDFLARRADAMNSEPAAESSGSPTEITSVELDPIAMPSFLARRADQVQTDEGEKTPDSEIPPQGDPTLQEKLPVALPGALAQRSDEAAEVEAPRRPSVQKHETVDLAHIEDLISEEADDPGTETPLGLQLIVTEPDGQIRHHPLVEGENLVGRGASADVALRYPDLSRRHATITVTDQSIQVRDLGSRNRTFVDDEQVDPESATAVEVEPGARLRFGSVEARLAKVELSP